MSRIKVKFSPNGTSSVSPESLAMTLKTWSEELYVYQPEASPKKDISMPTVKRWDYYLLDDGHCSPMRQIPPGDPAYGYAGWVMRSDHEAAVARLESLLKEAYDYVRASIPTIELAIEEIASLKADK